MVSRMGEKYETDLNPVSTRDAVTISSTFRHCGIVDVDGGGGLYRLLNVMPEGVRSQREK